MKEAKLAGDVAFHLKRWACTGSPLTPCLWSERVPGIPPDSRRARGRSQPLLLREQRAEADRGVPPGQARLPPG